MSATMPCSTEAESRDNPTEPWIATLSDLLAKSGSIQQTAFRMAGVRWSGRSDILSGRGAATMGGRWHAAGSPPTVYLADCPETTLAEYLQGNRRGGLPDDQALPGTMIGVQVSVSSILDLVDPAACCALDLTPDELLVEWDQGDGASPTQRLGRLARMVGFKGLRVPSAALKGQANLVIFRENLDTSQDVLQLIGQEALPDVPIASP